MKTRFLKVEAGIRHAVVLSAALLSACATVPQESPKGGAAAPQTAAPQKSTPAPAQQPAAQAQQPAAVPAQQPAPTGQATPPSAKKPKHNVEED